jgi:hypothetical protein
MLIEEKEYREGERTAVGIDPCKEFLQLAILSPDGKREFKKLPLSPSITEDHSDCLDAESIAKALVLIPDLPKVSFTEQKLLLSKLSRLRKRLSKASTAISTVFMRL